MLTGNFVVWLGVSFVLAFLATVPVHLHLRSMSKGSEPPTEGGSSVTLDLALTGGTSPEALLQKLGIRIVTQEVAMEAQNSPA